MRKTRVLTIFATTLGIGLGIPTFVEAQTTDAIRLADKEGIFIDSRTFSILPGRRSEELAGMLRMLDTRSLGRGAVIFRAGDNLYIAEAPMAAERSGGSRNDYGGSRNDYGTERYASSRTDYDNDRPGPPPDPQAERDWRAWQESLRLGYSTNRYGGSRNDYGSDRYGRDSGTSTAQAERDWREWQDSVRANSTNPRFGGSRNDD
jgi:hypothetical protein